MLKLFLIAGTLMFGFFSGFAQEKDNALVFNYEVKPWYKYRNDGKAGREVMLYFDHKLNDKLDIQLSINQHHENTTLRLKKAVDSISLLLPDGEGINSAKATIKLQSGDNEYAKIINIPAKKQWTVYIYPHSHVDIGYTNVQDVVQKLHVRNVDVGIDIANKTKDYPDGAKFIWNPEATWVVDSYLKTASKKQKQSFVSAVKKGWLQIDGAHSNINTSTCSDEQLMQVFKNNPSIERLTGVPIATMVQMDNPGASWGLVQAAAKNGIKGFFSFPNYFDLRHAWENKPFYWLSNNGKDKIFYLQATSYGYGYRAKGSIYGLGKIQAFTNEYDRLSTDHPLDNFIDPFIFEETAKLEAQSSPYDIFVMTWSMADNCLIDADLPEAVKLWNQKYAYPKLVIAGTRDILKAYESKYKNILPEYKGDMTEFWTEGLGSDAKRVAAGRLAKEDIIQAEALHAMLPKQEIPQQKFDQVWENLLLSAEHTWGYQDPKAPLAKQVEARKASYFEEAESESKALINLTLAPLKKESNTGLAVFNTLSWARSGMVKLTAIQSRAGDKVLNEKGKTMPSQRLSNGTLVFQADSIPAFGSAFYKVDKGKPAVADGVTTTKNQLKNKYLCITIDTINGNISSISDVLNKREYVDSKSEFGFDSYNHLAGVKNGNPEMMPGKPSQDTLKFIEVKEKGPLLSSIVIHSNGVGVNQIIKEITLIKDEPYLEIKNTIDKISTRAKEGIHYGFPFKVPSGQIRIDIPLGVMRPEADQLPFSNKNWFTFQRWIDVSNKDYGVSWTCIESPIVEFGQLHGNILDGARQAREWLKHVPETQTIFSWSLNNHWNTNFPLQQGGKIENRYMIKPHNGSFNPANAEHFGVESNRPLLVVEANQNPIHKSLINIDNKNITVADLKPLTDNNGLLIRLKSVSESEEQAQLTWPIKKPAVMYITKPNGQIISKVTNNINLLPHEIITLRAEFD